MRFFKKARLRDDEAEPWVASSNDKPDLSYASQYYRAHMDRIDTYYRPHPAMIPCDSTDKPAIIVKIPDDALRAFGERVTIKKYHIQAFQLQTYAVLWIRAFADDPEGSAIRAMTPGMTTVSTQDAADTLSAVPLDLFLDMADSEVQRWISSWIKWPDLMFLFVIEAESKIAAHLWYENDPSLAGTVRRCVRETQDFLAEIPAEKRNFEIAVQQLRAEITAY